MSTSPSDTRLVLNLNLANLANRFGISPAVVTAYLNGEEPPLLTEADTRGMARLIDTLHAVTRRESSGLHVDYIDAEVFADHHLAAIKVDSQHPAMRLVLHADDEIMPYVTSSVMAIPGKSALDLMHAEGATSAAVARVVLTKAAAIEPQ